MRGISNPEEREKYKSTILAIANHNAESFDLYYNDDNGEKECAEFVQIQNDLFEQNLLKRKNS
jgi:hypothetical protein